MPTFSSVVLALAAASSLVSAQRKVYTNEDLSNVDAIDIGTRSKSASTPRSLAPAVVVQFA